MEGIKLFAQKCFFWVCFAFGIGGALALVAFIASYFGLDIGNAATFLIVPLVSTLLFLKRKKQKILSSMEKEKNKFMVSCVAWMFRAAVITLGIVVICALIGVLYLFLWACCLKLIECLTGENILDSKITVIVILMGYAITVYEIFN